MGLSACGFLKRPGQMLLCRAWVKSPYDIAQVTWQGHVAWSWQQPSTGSAVQTCSSCLDNKVSAASMIWPFSECSSRLSRGM